MEQVYRCYSCKKIVIKRDIERKGHCKACGGRKVEPTIPTFIERVFLFLRTGVVYYG